MLPGVEAEMAVYSPDETWVADAAPCPSEFGVKIERSASFSASTRLPHGSYVRQVTSRWGPISGGVDKSNEEKLEWLALI